MAERPSITQAFKRRAGQHSAPVDLSGMDKPMAETLSGGDKPDYGITVPKWMSGIGNMLSGKKKAAAAPDTLTAAQKSKSEHDYWTARANKDYAKK